MDWCGIRERSIYVSAGEGLRLQIGPGGCVDSADGESVAELGLVISIREAVKAVLLPRGKAPFRGAAFFCSESNFSNWEEQP